MKLFHYTVGLKLRSIFEMQVLRTSPLKPKWPEKSICWLSSNAHYEASALKLGFSQSGTKTFTVHEMDSHCKGVYRFVFDSNDFDIDVEVLPWLILKPKSKMKPKLVKRLIDRAKIVNAAPSEWYGSFSELAIKKAKLERCEIMPDGTNLWVEVEPPAIDDNGVLQVTVDMAKKLGIPVECNDDVWRKTYQTA